ncbi:hypothetical protein LCGC14_1307250 [marine sediment metagenome]|uniref:Uncharacterized protein n=1 Tax=marine sediment metagenome TaxID=412755 RepID=A0A0F9N4H1_9ZZZZ
MSKNYIDSFFKQDFKELLRLVKEIANEIKELNKNLKKEN